MSKYLNSYFFRIKSFHLKFYTNGTKKLELTQDNLMSYCSKNKSILVISQVCIDYGWR